MAFNRLHAFGRIQTEALTQLREALSQAMAYVTFRLRARHPRALALAAPTGLRKSPEREREA